MGDYRSSEIREWREALHAFAEAYRDYLQQPDQAKRSAVIRALPEADFALTMGGGGYTFTDPPAMGSMRNTYTGLSQTAFLHEKPGWEYVNDRPTFASVIEGMETCDAALAVRERKARETEEGQRRNPFHWLDRGFRFMLRIPAYIVSAVVGQSVSQVDRSAFGFPLRVTAIVADVGGVYAVGRLIGIW